MNDKIKKMVEDGFSIAKISKILQLQRNDVNSLIKKNDWKLSKDVFDESKKSYIISLYKSGVSAKNLGIKYSTSKSRIQKWAEEEGILRKKSESCRLYTFNENVFDTIDNQEKAYWLGFLYADAYNYENKGWLNLTLKESDISHLIKFSEFMGLSDNCIKIRSVNLNNKIYGSCSLKINSKYLSNRLKELGCPQAKSFILTYPHWLDENLNFHFIRGYFDGDGCLTFRKNQKEWKWSLVGTKEMCEAITQIFTNQNILLNYYYISKTKNNTYELQSSGNLKIRKICDILYKNSSIHMGRKYQKYLQLKKQNVINHPLNFSCHKFNDIIKIDNMIMNTESIKKLNYEEKKQIVSPIINYISNTGFIFPDDDSLFLDEFKLLKDKILDLDNMELNNSSKLCTSICKYFCPSFFKSKSENGPSILNAFMNKDNIEKVVLNKLGLIKYVPNRFNFTMQSILSELKVMRLAGYVSIFKPLIAKYMYLKYSNINDIVYDYSSGFGGRLLGAMACNRKYIGVDPLTIEELKNMASFFNFTDCQLIKSGSENYKCKENSIDLSWSSPPFYNLEQYSDSLSQCYNKGEDYFYNVYWRQTLKNIKFMLKPNKWFGVNIDKNHLKMIDIAKEYFDNVIEEVKMKSYRFHFAGEKIKLESIYMFKNNK